MIIADNISRIPGQNQVNPDPAVQQGKPETSSTGAATTAGASEAAQAYENTAAKAQPVTSEGDRQLMKLLSQDYMSSTATYSSTIGKALSEAGLAQNARNYQIASLLLDSGLSISKDNIRYMVAETAAYPDTPASVLVDMQRAGIEINPENVRIVQDFADHSNSVVNDVNEILDLVETILSDPETSPELNTAIRSAIYGAVQSANEAQTSSPSGFNEALAHILGSDAAEVEAAQAGETAASQTGEAGNASANTSQAGNTVLNAAQTAIHDSAALPAGSVSAGTISSASSAINANPQGNDASSAAQANPQAARIVVETTPAGLPDEAATQEGGGSLSNQTFGNAAGGFAGQQAAQIIDDPSATASNALQGRLSDAESDRLYEDISNANLESAQDAGGIFESALDSNPDRTGLHRMLADEFKAMSPADLKKALKNALSIKPGDVGKEGIKELYKRTYEFIDKLKNAADNFSSNPDLGSKSQHAAKELETLYKLNSMYPHFELPIKLESGEGQSGLYVYANKRASQIKADRTSALLHLNMPNLGQVDIHLELNGKNLGMRFYSDDDAKAALRGNISELNDKLRSMDYSVSSSFNPREKEAADEAKLPVTSKEKTKESDTGKRYNFDIRA
ncbi:MAG: flagellar hook-length control protein FliK [Lachnospiraceae bacterium]|nr:flagellar hook-length control protein FliK [Lachnospiraceae bacterium]